MPPFFARREKILRKICWFGCRGFQFALILPPSFFRDKEENSMTNFRIQLLSLFLVRMKGIFFTWCPQCIMFCLCVIFYGYRCTVKSWCLTWLNFRLSLFFTPFLPPNPPHFRKISTFRIFLPFLPHYPSYFLMTNTPTNVRLLLSPCPNFSLVCEQWVLTYVGQYRLEDIIFYVEWNNGQTKKYLLAHIKVYKDQLFCT